MSHEVPSWGKVPEKQAEDQATANDVATNHTSPRRSFGRKSQQRTLQARNDAQQGLNALITPQRDDTQPHVISASGLTRNQKRGRIAGPTAGGTALPGHASGGSGRLLNSGKHAASPSSLAIVPGSHAAPDAVETIRSVPQTRLERTTALATEHLKAARERTGLLISAVDESAALGIDVATLNTSRRAAARWATRYATHMVILVVVSALVALGGLKTLTVQGAYPHGLHAVDAYTGTDHFEDGEHEHEGEDGKPAVDSPEFDIALPRTELGGTDASTNSVVAPPAARNEPVSGPQESAPESAPVRTITQYTVVRGDSINSIAAKFHLMPETIMGSNGIYDTHETLEPGRVLTVLPVDGMYHVAAEGDTLESVARRYQADPAALLAYAGNDLANGVKPGLPLVVPGGMMPARESVITYTVKTGDSLRDVAARFGVDVPTMLESNDIPDPDNLKVGSSLRVLPVPGLEYKVRKGDTINAVAERFSVTPQMILDFSPNNLSVDSTLQIDQVIVVPGGRPEREVVVAAARVEPVARGESGPAEVRPAAPAPPKKEAPAKKAAAPEPPPKATPKPAPKPDNSPKVGTGRMVWPVRGTITQYFSRRHNGLDIATRAGTPLQAADSGRVIWSGWRADGLGYAVMIDHGNGLTTIYGHMLRQPPVYVGQYVSRGQKIGLIGSTGRSTGPHVHFMVKSGAGRNYRNPLAYLGK